MNLQHLEEQVVTAEERALHLSLVGYHRLEAGELVEAWQNIDAVEAQLKQFSCEKGQRLLNRLAGVRAELEAAEAQFARAGKGSVPPVAA